MSDRVDRLDRLLLTIAANAVRLPHSASGRVQVSLDKQDAELLLKVLQSQRDRPLPLASLPPLIALRMGFSR